MTLTNEILDELERLEKAAYSAPWEHDCDDPNPDGSITNEHGGVGIMYSHPHGNIRTVFATGEQFSHATSRLIVAARNHLPALIAAARERQTCETWCGNLDDVMHLKSELAATRRALRLAQARALTHMAKRVVSIRFAPNERARRLMMHYAAKFERMAAEGT